MGGRKPQNLIGQVFGRFDFAILNEDKTISHLIEVDGIQHFVANGGWSTEEHLKLTKKKRRREKCVL